MTDDLTSLVSALDMMERMNEMERWKQRAEAAEAREAALREALEYARAAVWNAYYGKGISVEYARKVDAKTDMALAFQALAAQPKEQSDG